MPLPNDKSLKRYKVVPDRVQGSEIGRRRYGEFTERQSTTPAGGVVPVDFQKQVIFWTQLCDIQNHHAHLTALPSYHAPFLPGFANTIGVEILWLLSTGFFLDTTFRVICRPPSCRAHGTKYHSGKQKTQTAKMDLTVWVSRLCRNGHSVITPCRNQHYKVGTIAAK